MKYRKLPVVIDAIQLEDSVECMEALSNLGLDPIVFSYADKDPVLRIETLEGTMIAEIGDFIIKGVNGEFYPCKPDIFEKTYEKEASAEPSEIGCIPWGPPDVDVLARADVGVDVAHTPCACGGDTSF